MGGATPRDTGPRSYRGRSELRLDVWASQPTRENRSSGCRGPRRGVSPWDLSMCTSPVATAADGAVAAECAARAGRRANPPDLGGARDHALARLSDCRWRDGHVFDPTRRVGAPGV